MTPRETRLRERIDVLLDEREQLRMRLAAMRRLRRRDWTRVSAARQRAELWRARALRRGAS